MKILWVKAGGIVPCDTGGKIRSFQILRELAKRHQVTLFTFYPEHPNDEHPRLKGFAEVIAVPVATPRTRTWDDYVRYASQLFAKHPYSMEKFYSPAVRDTAAAVQARNDFDVLVCDFLAPAGVVDWRRSVPKILFTHNVEAQIWERQSRLTKNPLWKFVYWREARLLARAEERYLQLADHVLTVSENDRQFFRNYVLPEKVTAIPTGVDVEYFRPGNAQEDPRSMVFTGSMDWMPNDDGVVFFTQEILPKILAEEPAAKLLVVGRRPTRRVEALAGDRIEVTGAVDDIRPYVDRSRVYVVPLRSGSGTRIKIFEAMAMGKAVVSTTLGAEGLPVTHGRDIVIADTPADFAAAVVGLLRDRTRAAELGREARQLVERRYSWPAVVDCFEPIFQKVTAGAAARTRLAR
jgi:sugar transferase (PEP-CTERM/EpsH1 system associated)